MSGIRWGATVIDCPDPMGLARFYGALLDIAVSDESTDEWAELVDGSPTLSFQRIEGYTPPSWPDGPAQQIHLDLSVDSLVDSHRRAMELGATPLSPTEDPGPDARGFRVYADPAGHPFCLCACALDRPAAAP